MMLGRRGFLQTLAAATVGLAQFDPASLLWVPASAGPVTLHGTDAISDTAAQALIDQQLELNALALQCAERLGERLRRHTSVALREIMYRHTGNVHLPKHQVLDIDDLGRGLFVPSPTRLMVAAPFNRDWLGEMTSQLHGQMLGRNLDMFAPVSAERHDGGPWSPDVRIGLATDPESGLSVRVLRFVADQFRGPATLTAIEVAGGQWKTLTRLQREAEDEAAAIERERRWIEDDDIDDRDRYNEDDEED